MKSKPRSTKRPRLDAELDNRTRHYATKIFTFWEIGQQRRGKKQKMPMTLDLDGNAFTVGELRFVGPLFGRYLISSHALAELRQVLVDTKAIEQGIVDLVDGLTSRTRRGLDEKFRDAAGVMIGYLAGARSFHIQRAIEALLHFLVPAQVLLNQFVETKRRPSPSEKRGFSTAYQEAGSLVDRCNEKTRGWVKEPYYLSRFLAPLGKLLAGRRITPAEISSVFGYPYKEIVGRITRFLKAEKK